MKKQGWLVMAVTTQEAFHGCLDECCSVFCVEDPLYTEIRDHLSELPCIADYDVTFYDDQHFAILKKVRGAEAFDDSRFELYYYPLHGL